MTEDEYKDQSLASIPQQQQQLETRAGRKGLLRKPYRGLAKGKSSSLPQVKEKRFLFSRRIFKMLDRDKNGEISAGELATALGVYAGRVCSRMSVACVVTCACCVQ